MKKNLIKFLMVISLLFAGFILAGCEDSKNNDLMPPKGGWNIDMNNVKNHFGSERPQQ